MDGKPCDKITTGDKHAVKKKAIVLFRPVSALTSCFDIQLPENRASASIRRLIPRA
jgi:hypothetical protein